MKSYDDKKSNKIKNNDDIVASFNNAINGIIESINTERNLKVHIIIGILVLALSFILNFTRVELILISITIVLVIVAELINTAIETLTDLACDGKYNELAKKTKDISAGAVLVMALNSVFVGYLIIYPKIKSLAKGSLRPDKLRINEEHLLLISLGLVILITLLLKGLFYKKNTTHLKGGIVSGHTSLSFNLATIGAIISKDILVSMILFILAIVVGQSRYEARIHTIREIIYGAILGTVIALLLFINFI